MYYIDFDGVILDTIPAIDAALKENGISSFCEASHEFLSKKLDYEKIVEEVSVISHAFERLNEFAQLFGPGIILTRVNSCNEAYVKWRIIQEETYGYRFIPVPIQIKNGIYYLPKKTEYAYAKGSILIDDDKSNIDDWILAGGTGLLFTNTFQEGYQCIDDLKDAKRFILKL